jgi:Dockerin type I domain
MIGNLLGKWRIFLFAFLLWFSSGAQAAFHLWIVNEVYSNASGTIQFIEFSTQSTGQQFLATHTVSSSNGANTNTFTYPSNIQVGPGDSTANKKFLMATTGFAALGLVAPDYIMPDGFLFTSNLTVNFSNFDILSNLTLPTDGVLSLNRGAGTTMTSGTNSPTNFAGVTGSIAPSASPPGAPTIGTATAGQNQASITFLAPANNGGSAITGYTATCGSQSATGTASPITVSGLTAGVAVTCSVTATNAAGTGPASAASNSVIPFDVPGAPVFNSAIAGDSQITALFSPPANAGGSPIISYTVQCAADMQMTQFNTGSASPITVTAMVNEVAYTCGVIATNAAGNSAPSNLLVVTPSAMVPLTLTGVQSRKTHAATGTFDLTLDTAVAISGAVTVESRAIGAGHSIVFQFNKAITASGTASAVDTLAAPIGATSVSTAGNEVVVTLTGLPDNRRATVALNGVNAEVNNFPVSIGFLVGDVNNSRSVNASDISGVKARSGQTTAAGNFRFDLNASGGINATDISAVKARSGLVLP